MTSKAATILSTVTPAIWPRDKDGVLLLDNCELVVAFDLGVVVGKPVEDPNIGSSEPIPPLLVNFEEKLAGPQGVVEKSSSN